MNYAGFYINLDRSTKRRAEMEAQLAAFGLAEHYKRFPAANGNVLGFPNPKLLDGETGCFTSHYLLLKENIGHALPLHIVEDDVLLSRFMAPAVDSVIASGNLDHYDIIFTDVYPPVSNILYKKYRALYQKSITRDDRGNAVSVAVGVIDMKDVGFAGTTSMIVSPASISKLASLYAEALEKGAEKPIDLFLRQKTDDGHIKTGCIFPFVTSIRFEDSLFDTTIGDAEPNLSNIAGTLARYAFFADCDWDKCREYAAKYLPAPAKDAQTQILMQILGASLDEKFRFR